MARHSREAEKSEGEMDGWMTSLDKVAGLPEWAQLEFGTSGFEGNTARSPTPPRSPSSSIPRIPGRGLCCTSTSITHSPQHRRHNHAFVDSATNRRHSYSNWRSQPRAVAPPLRNLPVSSIVVLLASHALLPIISQRF